MTQAYSYGIAFSKIDLQIDRRTHKVIAKSARIMPVWADVPPGTLVVVTGSNGLLEIAERDGSAARRLGLTRGTPVLFRAHARGGAGAGED